MRSQTRRRSLWSLTAWAFALLGTVGAPAAALGVILGSGNDSINLTDSSLQSVAPGLGTPSAPGFDSVGISSTGNASMTYLSNGWAITAGHVYTQGTVQFGGTNYSIGEIVPLYNTGAENSLNDNSLSDLKMVHLSSNSPYPSIASIAISQIATSTASGTVYMMGNGLNAGSQNYWSVDTSNPMNAVWTQLGSAPSGAPPPNTAYYSGFMPGGQHEIRWGDNLVVGAGTLPADGYTTQVFYTNFDNANPNYGTGQTPLNFEAQASSGDSGGAVFAWSGSQWVLSGIMIDIGKVTNNPNDPENNTPMAAAGELFGDSTFIADLSQYSSQIAALLPTPEPSGIMLAAMGFVGFAAWGWRQRSRPA